MFFCLSTSQSVFVWWSLAYLRCYWWNQAELAMRANLRVLVGMISRLVTKYLFLAHCTLRGETLVENQKNTHVLF